MIRRLVLEWDLPHRVLVGDTATSRRSTEVISSDEETVHALRERGVPVMHADPRDGTVIEGAGPVELVVVGSREPERTRSILQEATRVLPGATHVAYRPYHREVTWDPAIDSMADRIIDAAGAIRGRIQSLANAPATVRTSHVRRILTTLDGELAIFTHDNPDPDAIASASALERIATQIGVSAETYYYGQITHQSNRAFVNLLDLSLNQLDPGAAPPDAGGYALVDHASPGVNDSLPADQPIDLIFDHHTPGAPVDARLVDLRESVGATSTIMTEYLEQLGIDPEPWLASALVYGITTDTRSFMRGVSVDDFEAAASLWTAADHEALARIEHPNVSPETLGTLAEAIASRRVEGRALATCVGRLQERDALGQAADLLIQMNGVDICLVSGITVDVVEISARARPGDRSIDLATILRDAFGAIGSAGGHEEMAGASIPLGILGSVDGEPSEDLVAVVRSVVEDRFFETVPVEIRHGFD